MKAARAIVMGGFVLFQAQAVAAECTPDAFQGWFHASARGKLRVPAAVERRAKQFRYVFVGGFASERMPGYFAQSEKELVAHGVAPESIHRIFPSSRQTFDGNRDEVRSRFREVASRGPERLVVIAHSRGAGDALAFALRNEPFVRDRVEALFLVQGAFGGTGAADYLMGEGLLMDRRMPARLRMLAYLLGRFETLLMHKGKHGGLSGMTRAESERFWRRTLEEHAGAIPVVGRKTFYVTSRVSPSRLRLFRRAIGTYLQTYYGPNDGMVVLRDQSLPGLGACLVVLDAAHTDLTHRFPATRAPRRFRRALVESVLMAVGGAENVPGDPPRARLHRVRRRRR